MIYIDTPYMLDVITDSFIAYTAADTIPTRIAEHRLLNRAYDILDRLGMGEFKIEYEVPSLSYNWGEEYYYLVRSSYARFRNENNDIDNDEAYNRIIGVDMEVFNAIRDSLFVEEIIELAEDHLCSQVTLKLTLTASLSEEVRVIRNGCTGPLKYVRMDLKVRATIPEDERKTLIELGKIVEEEVVTKQVRTTCDVTGFKR